MALNFNYKNTGSWKAILGSGYGVSGYDAAGNYFDTNKSSSHYALPTAKIATPQGLQTYNAADEKNVMGYATQTTDLKGNTTVNKANENLSGYSVASTKPGEFSDVDKSTAVVENVKNSGQRLRSSGNITLWPTIYQETDVKGNVVDSFVIPGFLPAGSLAYKDNGVPYYKDQSNNAPAQAAGYFAPLAAVQPPTAPAAPSPAPVISPDNNNTALAAADNRRRRSSLFSTYMSNLGSTL